MPADGMRDTPRQRWTAILEQDADEQAGALGLHHRGPSPGHTGTLIIGLDTSVPRDDGAFVTPEPSDQPDAPEADASHQSDDETDFDDTDSEDDTVRRQTLRRTTLERPASCSDEGDDASCCSESDDDDGGALSALAFSGRHRRQGALTEFGLINISQSSRPAGIRSNTSGGSYEDGMAALQQRPLTSQGAATTAASSSALSLTFAQNVDSRAGTPSNSRSTPLTNSFCLLEIKRVLRLPQKSGYELHRDTKQYFEKVTSSIQERLFNPARGDLLAKAEYQGFCEPLISGTKPYKDDVDELATYVSDLEAAVRAGDDPLLSAVLSDMRSQLGGLLHRRYMARQSLDRL